MIERAFVTIKEGQIHLRRQEVAVPTGAPLLMLHASPSSSWGLEGLMSALAAEGCGRTLIAPDTLGNGDSVPPGVEAPDIAYFADSMFRMIDALGLETVDLYGAHTGARIACEFAAAYPDRIGRVIFDGITEYDDEMRRDIIAHYAPRHPPDDHGGQLIWAFNFVRDQWLYFPHFRRDPAHRLGGAMPSAAVLHRATLDVLKALDTYSKPYIAAFQYRAFERMPAIKAPTLLLKPDSELAILNAAIDNALRLLPDGRVVTVTGGEAGKAAAINAFLNAPS